MASQKIAQADEILELLTKIMRGRIEPGREQMRAAEMLGKRLGLFGAQPEEEYPVVIIEGGDRLK